MTLGLGARFLSALETISSDSAEIKSSRCFCSLLVFPDNTLLVLKKASGGMGNS